MKIKKNVELAPYTTFGIGGPADYFIEAETKKKIVEAVQWARKKKLPYFILGSGSNLLVSDHGFRGLVVKCQMLHIKCQNTRIVVGSGFSLAKLLLMARDNNLTGLEHLVGIPGTIGGAVVGNAGTKSGFISQAIEKVEVLGEDGLIYDLNNQECCFQYRSSRFKKTKEIILEVVFQLKKEDRTAIDRRMDQTRKERKNQPPGKSIGSIFKNPNSYSAGSLIEKVGLKGKKIGDAAVSREHANWIINLGHARAVDVVKLIDLCKKKVKEKFNLGLEEEIILVGEFD